MRTRDEPSGVIAPNGIVRVRPHAGIPSEPILGECHVQLNHLDLVLPNLRKASHS